MTLADVIEATLFAWCADGVIGRPLPELVATVLGHPDLLVSYAELCVSDQVTEARHLSHAIAAGIEPETVDGQRWFMPGSAAP